MYEIGGFIVHFFSTDKIVLLEKDYVTEDIEDFEEGELPKKLFMVIQRKKVR